MNQSFIRATTTSAFNTAGLAAGYASANGAGFSNPLIMMRLVNASGQVITLSYDGVNDHDILLANSSLQYDFQTNHAPNGNVAMLRKGTIVYVKGTGGAGTLYIIGYYVS